MTWDWIIDTLGMIETDLGQRTKMCDSRVRREVQDAAYAVQKAKGHMIRAVQQMQKSYEDAVAKREKEEARRSMAGEPALIDPDVPF